MILVTQLFLSLQSRPDANMADFFRFENRRGPPSLANRGALRARKKSDILQGLGATTGRVAAAQANNAAGMAHEQVGDGRTPIPKSEWNSGFLENEDNKKELFSFTSRQICKSDVNGTLLLST